MIQCFNAVTAKGILASTLKVEYLKKYGKNVLFTTKILIFQFVTDITLFSGVHLPVVIYAMG